MDLGMVHLNLLPPKPPAFVCKPSLTLPQPRRRLQKVNAPICTMFRASVVLNYVLYGHLCYI